LRDWSNLSLNNSGITSGTGLVGTGLAWPNVTANWNATTSVYGFNQPSTTITLDGPDADISINGISLVDTLKVLQERLNVLVPNPELEKEWDQLRELREQYRALEHKLKEQGDMWAKLKSMPPSDIS
jgi:hypothetical protein